MFTFVTRVLASGFALWAAWSLLRVPCDEEARGPRLFLAAGMLFWAGFWAATAAMRPFEGLRLSLLMGSVSRGLFVWTTVGVVLIARQRSRMKGPC